MANREAANFFFFIYRNDVGNDEKKEKNLKNVKKKYWFGTYKVTRAVDRKHNYF